MKQFGLVLGTFLPFHKGHEFLVNFALNYCDEVYVIASTRSQEPIAGYKRVAAIRNTFMGKPIHVVEHNDDNAPQNPVGDNDVDFWNYWKNTINGLTGSVKFDYVFSSENYGEKVAEILEAKHITVDKSRTILPISGTTIRKYPIAFQDQISDHMVKHLRKHYVMFGAESIGKTTMTKLVAHDFTNAHCIPEYARPYLESQEDKSPSIPNMRNIFRGQYAYEASSKNELGGSCISVLDTDLMSTVGYARMVGMDWSEYETMVDIGKDNIYFVLGQNEVPFEADILRYGGDKRESDDQYWIDLLNEFDRKFVYVTGTLEERRKFIIDYIRNDVKKLFEFERE